MIADLGLTWVTAGVHPFPRFRGDPYGAGPIDPQLGSFTRTPEELDRLRETLRSERRATSSHRAPV